MRRRSRMNVLCSAECPRLLLAAIALAVLSGCRHGDVNRELVERELRLQEDEIYHLHGEVSERETRLAATRRENDVLKRELAEARSPGGTPSPRVDLPPAPDVTPRMRRPGEEPPAADASPPVIEVPGLDGPPPGESGNGPPGRRNGAWRSMRGGAPRREFSGRA